MVKEASLSQGSVPKIDLDKNCATFAENVSHEDILRKLRTETFSPQKVRSLLPEEVISLEPSLLQDVVSFIVDKLGESTDVWDEEDKEDAVTILSKIIPQKRVIFQDQRDIFERYLASVIKQRDGDYYGDIFPLLEAGEFLVPHIIPYGDIHSRRRIIDAWESIFKSVDDSSIDYDEFSKRVSDLEDKRISGIDVSVEERRSKVFILFEIEGFSYREIAKELHISLDTVKKDISVLRKKGRDIPFRSKGII